MLASLIERVSLLVINRIVHDAQKPESYPERMLKTRIAPQGRSRRSGRTRCAPATKATLIARYCNQ